jgi:hypothetical protein
MARYRDEATSITTEIEGIFNRPETEKKNLNFTVGPSELVPE